MAWSLKEMEVSSFGRFADCAFSNSTLPSVLLPRLEVARSRLADCDVLGSLSLMKALPSLEVGWRISGLTSMLTVVLLPLEVAKP